MTIALRELGNCRTNAAQTEVRLTEATNALAALPPKDETQERVHEKLRVEIARLSEDTIRKDALIKTMKGQAQALQESKGKTEASLQAVQAALATTSNEVVRLRTSDADKAALLAAREQELANVRSELAASNKAGQEAAEGKTAAEKTVQELQAKSGADQAELARLKQHLAELESGKARAAAPAPAPATP
jgi:septal ring factor EnvC (AmiA/AmiB activator)